MVSYLCVMFVDTSCIVDSLVRTPCVLLQRAAWSVLDQDQERAVRTGNN